MSISVVVVYVIVECRRRQVSCLCQGSQSVSHINQSVIRNNQTDTNCNRTGAQ
jgi:hypothetical protein